MKKCYKCFIASLVENVIDVLNMDFGYEKLDVAKLAKTLVNEIYSLTIKYPIDEKFGLTSQTRRAAISVLLNIAEGSCRTTKKDFNYFVRIAVGSLVETNCALKIGIDLKFIDNEKYQNIEPMIKELYFKLIGLSKFLSAPSK